MEIEITKERLASLFPKMAFEYALVIYGIEKGRTGLLTSTFKAQALVHRAVAHVLSLLAGEDTKTL